MEKIIHQLWKDENVPTEYGDPESWKRLNPDWKYILWTDASMLDFVKAEFPDMLEFYETYRHNVQRADLFRYLVVYKLGGLYADIDTDCFHSLDIFENEQRVVVCDEPTLHTRHESPRGFIPLQLNATFASPAGHPFWPTLFEKMQNTSERIRHDFILDSTGPCMLAGALEDYHDQSAISYNSSHLFNPLTSAGEWEREPRHGDYGHLTVCAHNWQGSWFGGPSFQPIKAVHNVFWGARATRYKQMETPPSKRFRKLNLELLLRDASTKPTEPQVSIMVPARDCADKLETHWKVLEKLSYPKNKLRLVYVEGGSKDKTLEKLQAFEAENPLGFKEVVVIGDGPYARLPYSERRLPRFQYKRRNALARARNMALDKALDPQDDWVLWMNTDVEETPADILETMLAQKARIVAPNCVDEYGETSSDYHCFFTIGGDRTHVVARQIYRRIYQASFIARRRLYLSDLRYLGRARLSSAGTSLFLVDADLHRAGVNFPEDPYKFLIEAEGFSLWAKDLGVDIVGLPSVEVLIERVKKAA